jgi:O-antigen/teichoic acid export membrane protein
LKPFISYGGWVSVSGIISPLMAFGDRFFVSMILGVSVLPVYAIPQEGLGRLLLIPTALTGALMPRMSQEKSIESLKSLYKHYFRKISLIMFAICSLTALMSYPVLKIWISPSFATHGLNSSYHLFGYLG